MPGFSHSRPPNPPLQHESGAEELGRTPGSWKELDRWGHCWEVTQDPPQVSQEVHTVYTYKKVTQSPSALGGQALYCKARCPHPEAKLSSLPRSQLPSRWAVGKTNTGLHPHECPNGHASHGVLHLAKQVGRCRNICTRRKQFQVARMSPHLGAPALS